MIDEYVRGIVERISPEAPVPVVQEIETNSVPGGAGNVVCNLVSLGCRVYPVGVIGQDESGKKLKRMFSNLGIPQEDLCFYEAAERPTTIKTRILAGNQQVCRLDRELRTPLSAEMEERLIGEIEKKIDSAAAIIFSDYDKGVVTPQLIERTVALAHSKGVFIAVDPQVTHFSYYKKVDVLTPNHHEAGRYLGRSLVTDEQIEEGGEEIRRRLDARKVLITRGEKGMSLIETGAPCRHFPTRAREVFDVTGAGDTVISIFTVAEVCGATEDQAVHLSNAGAGVVVGKIGAATVTTEDLRTQL